MSDRVTCPECGATFNVPDGLAYQGLDLHNRAQHPSLTRVCTHEWRLRPPDGTGTDLRVCVHCGKEGLVFRTRRRGQWLPWRRAS